MKVGMKEYFGVRRIHIQCSDEHIKGLYRTGYVPHAGVHNKVLNIGGYYSKDPLYNDTKPLFTHDRSNFYVLNNPTTKLITGDVNNPILKMLINSYGNYDLLRYVSSIKNNYYGSEQELNNYLKFCDDSHQYLNKLNYILNKLNSNGINNEDKMNIIKNYKKDLDKIYIYKELKFNDVIYVYDEILKIINNL